MVNITKTIDFTLPGDFQENSEIVINGNGASLVPINNLQSDWTCGARFDTNLNLNWGNGSLIGTPSGAVITDGRLDLRGNNKYLELSATGNASSSQKGSVKFMFTPNYSGNPAALVSFFSIFGHNASIDNDLMLYHDTDGQMHIFCGDKDGNQIFDVGLAVWNPTNGSEYEFELDYNITDGATALFINGIKIGSTITTTGERSNNITVMRLGGNYNGAAFCNGYFRNLLITNDVQHTSNYTPGYTIPAQAQSFPTDSPAILPKGMANQLPTTGLVSMIANSQVPNGTDIKMVIVKADGNAYYHNGSSWVQSTGASESNSISSLTSAILEALNLSDGEVIEFYFYLVSTGNATPVLVNLTITAHQYLPNNDEITPCTVYGYALDASGNPVSGVNVTASLDKDTPYESETLIVKTPAPALTNALGYWQLDLLPLDVSYKFTFTLSSAPAYEVSKKVPKAQSAAFNTLES